MARYATGKKSKAISDISGFKVNYTDLKTTYDNLRVEPSDFDPKHPQLTPAKNVIDATALFQPRPDNDPENVSFIVGFNTDIFASKIENAQKGIGVKGLGSLGTFSIVLSHSQDVTGVSGTGAVGAISFSAQVSETEVAGTGAVGLTNSIVNTLTVTVQSVSDNNKYFIGGSQQATVSLVEGNTYRFDQSDSSNDGHPLRLSTTPNGTHDSGSEYTTGVTTNGTPGTSGAYTQITVASDAPTLYYYCSNHSAMGGTANTPTNVSVTVTAKVIATGVDGDGAIGTLALEANPIMTGVSGTGAIGTESVNVGGWGQEAWGSSGWGDT
jgi:flagellar basal body L-ring protein FlgH